MDDKTAIKLAKRFLCDHIELKIHPKSMPVPGIYNFDPDDEILMSYSLFNEIAVGSSKYISISKTDGTVKHIGKYGE